MKKATIFVSFMIIMIVMGASDSFRGIFALVFEKHFNLTSSLVSLIITVSYLGNLIFLFFGGSFIDRYPKKTVFIAVLLTWLLGATLFILTDNYYALLFGMFLCMGTSTLMNTTINILVPAIFASSPGLIVNILFFIQGIGTSGSQNAAGRFATSFFNWKAVNGVLMIPAIVGLILLMLSSIPDVKQENKVRVTYKSVMKKPAFFFFTLIFGFYFIAEHGLLNWLVVYGTKELDFTTSKASMYLSLFFGGITIGRLLFAPVVGKFGITKSIGFFGGIGTLLYIVGITAGSKMLILLGVSGLSLSIIYPTLVLMIQKYFESDRVATATGAVISIATIFDIGFNAIFGTLIDSFGLKLSFYILPVSMALFCLLYFLFLKTVKPIRE